MTLSLDELARALIVRDTDVLRIELGDRWSKRLPAAPTARIYAATLGAACSSSASSASPWSRASCCSCRGARRTRSAIG